MLIMHEWALAEAVLESVKRHLNEQEQGKSLQVKSVNLLFGELQEIDEEIFRSGLNTMLADYPFNEDVIHIETDPALFGCNVCKREWTLKDQEDLSEDEREAIHFLPEAAHVFIRCPGCGSPDFRVIKGRGVSIGSIILEEV
ncbi:MAG TPA: hydrogenase nickel incorporation protein HypA [Spirochaetales bacterium]|nr:hydrogenase nickel incorporation protein HypA [Spirochaetales bacterium]